MAIGKVAREALDRVAAGYVKHFAADLGFGAGDIFERLRDAAAIAPGQVHDIGGIEAAGKLLRQGKAEVARCAGYQSYFVHVVIDINILIRVKSSRAAEGGRLPLSSPKPS